MHRRDIAKRGSKFKRGEDVKMKGKRESEWCEMSEDAGQNEKYIKRSHKTIQLHHKINWM